VADTGDARARAFIAAVVTQLAGTPDAAVEGEDAGQRVGALLAAAARGGAEGTAAARALADDHVFLASVFQNVDLLYAHDHPNADALSLVVMEALGILAGRPPVD
jgi:hypothetical protein